ncbi:MAG: imidazole glycerol phosphate synthase subunit HisH [Rhodovibrionaceae bacterium]
MQVAVIDYGSGNLRSAAKALERAAREAELDAEILVTAEAAAVARADRVVLPGVGAFADCRAGVDAVDGLREALEEVAIVRARPFLGICVGMQLMATVGREHGDHPGFGWIPGEVVPLAPADPALKVPQMGWNELEIRRDHPLLAGLGSDPHVYFVHSYHLRTEAPEHVLATADYGGAVTAAAGRDNLAGTQFHPEKSQAAGLALLRNFLRWRP